MTASEGRPTARDLVASRLATAKLVTSAAHLAATSAASSVLAVMSDLDPSELRALAQRLSEEAPDPHGGAVLDHDEEVESESASAPRSSDTENGTETETGEMTSEADATDATVAEDHNESTHALSEMIEAVSAVSSEMLRSPRFTRAWIKYCRDVESDLIAEFEEGRVDRPAGTLLEQLLQGVDEQAATELPRRVSTRDLSRNTADVLARLHREPRSAVITYRGVPSFLLVPIDRGKLSSLLLSISPQLDADIADAHEALERGEGTLGEPEPSKDDW